MRLSILVVEDDIEVRQLLVKVLANGGGFSVCAAGDVNEAQQVMAECGVHFSLAVVDVTLPDGDGRDFCAGLRRQGCHTPVILLTGPVQKDDVIRGLDAGADDYLAKLFNTDELLARVRAQLRRVDPRPDTWSQRRHGTH